jgi:hypothetical protein
MYTRVSPATKNRFNFSFETKDKKKNILGIEEVFYVDFTLKR